MSFTTLRRRALIGVAGASLVLTLPLGLSATSAVATTSPSTSTTVSASASSTATQAAAKAVAATKKATRAAAKKKAAAKRKANTPKAIAKRLVKKKGWSARQYRCLKSLWHRESGWRVHAANSSGAYGIPQALPGYKMGTGWRHSARAQIKWGLKYIDGRYNTPCSADSHQRSRNWY